MDGLLRFKEQVAKENNARRHWKEKYGSQEAGWRPVEPFEKNSCSRRACNIVSAQSALHVGSEGRGTQST